MPGKRRTSQREERMRATILNCSLKPSSEPSNTQLLADVVIDALRREHGVESQVFRLADLDIRPGVESDMGEGDGWPEVREAIVSSQILIVATPTWVGHLSSIAQRA